MRPQRSWEEDRRKRRGVERLCIPPGAPLRRSAGEALLEARTQASVALFKLGAHDSATALRSDPNLEGLKV